MPTHRIFIFLGITWLTLADCARQPKPSKEPVAEAVRPPEAPTPPTAARDLADVMTTTLRLRPDQTLKIRQIFNSTVEQVNAARQQYPAKSPQLNIELKRINTSSESQLRETLGPASYQEFQNKKRQIQAEMQQRQVK